jgi:DNA-directed RNA polymerase alpha subunit
MADEPRGGPFILKDGSVVDAFGKPHPNAKKIKAASGGDEGSDDSTALTADFPARAELEKAKITTVDAVKAKTDADLEALPNVGAATVVKIRAALAALEKK